MTNGTLLRIAVVPGRRIVRKRNAGPYPQRVRTLRRLLTFLRPYRKTLWTSLGLAWLAMGMTVLIPWLLGESVNAIEAGDGSKLWPLAGAIVGAGVLRLALTSSRRVVAGRVSLGVEYDLRQRFYGHLQELELGFFDSQQTGQLMSRATVDLQAIRFFLGYGLIFITQNLLTIILAAAVMLAVNPVLALLALSPLPLLVVTARRYNRISRPALQESQQRVAELTADAEESVSGVRVIKAFAREAWVEERFARTTKRVFDQSVYATRLRSFYTPTMAFLPSIGVAVVLFFGGREVLNGSISLGEFTAFYTYLLILSAPVRVLGSALGMAQRAVASGNRLFEIIDRKPQLTEAGDAVPLPAGQGTVRMVDVTFTYPTAQAEDHSLQDIDLEINAGRTIALVGPTASGKTTLAALIARLYDVDSGLVEVDGVDVREVELSSLRSQVAFVADDSFLFSDTVANNIAYADVDATREEIVAAAKRAQAHSFIEKLPDGYDTVVGERGLTLSGGQRQRVAIARALLAQPRILILDDATSSVDATTEAKIKQGLREVMADRTTLIVAHRLSTISLADEIVVMDQGRIVDVGSHTELLERCSLYAEIAEKGLEDSVYLQRDLEQREEIARL